MLRFWSRKAKIPAPKLEFQLGGGGGRSCRGGRRAGWGRGPALPGGIEAGEAASLKGPLSPTFSILRCLEHVFFSAHTYALSGYVNVPTNRPIPAHQAHTARCPPPNTQPGPPGRGRGGLEKKHMNWRKGQKCWRKKYNHHLCCLIATCALGDNKEF